MDKTKIHLPNTEWAASHVISLPVHPKVRKRDFRRLWIIRINAAIREHGMNYSEFIYRLKTAKIEMDRKTLAYLAMEEPELFAQIAQTAKTKLAA